MIFHKTNFNGLFLINLEPYTDDRGIFTRTYCYKEYFEAGINFKPIQINRSLNHYKGTLRGLHFQTSPNSEAKSIQCQKGKIFDVAVDLRLDSTTFGQWYGIILEDSRPQILHIPIGFAHGFQTLVDDCVIEYHMSEFYNPGNSSGIIWSDPKLNIPWPIKDPIISNKDKNWPLMENL